MITSRQRLLWAGLLAGASFAAAAQAPVAPAAEPKSGPKIEQAHRHHHARAEHRRDPAQRLERMREHQAKRLAALKQKLALNASQEGAWQSFAGAQQPPARPPQRMTRAELEKLTTPQRLDHMQARQAERAERFAARASATRSFYAALDANQQKVFDAESMRFGHRGHRGGEGHHHGRHHGSAEASPAAPARS
jgi:hypothetical protein